MNKIVKLFPNSCSFLNKEGKQGVSVLDKLWIEEN